MRTPKTLEEASTLLTDIPGLIVNGIEARTDHAVVEYWDCWYDRAVCVYLYQEDAAETIASMRFDFCDRADRQLSAVTGGGRKPGA